MPATGNVGFSASAIQRQNQALQAMQVQGGYGVANSSSGVGVGVGVGGVANSGVVQMGGSTWCVFVYMFMYYILYILCIIYYILCHVCICMFEVKKKNTSTY